MTSRNPKQYVFQRMLRRCNISLFCNNQAMNVSKMVFLLFTWSFIFMHLIYFHALYIFSLTNTLRWLKKKARLHILNLILYLTRLARIEKCRGMKCKIIFWKSQKSPSKKVPWTPKKVWNLGPGTCAPLILESNFLV